MTPLPRTLLTTLLCGVLGAVAGKWSQPTAETSPARTTAVRSPAAISKVARIASKPPPFTSVTASMEWLRSQMEKGDATAAQRLFYKDAGLSEDQRLGLAKELVINFRRQHPRVLASILLGLQRGEAADRLLYRFLSNWCSYDAEEALQFIEALPSDRLGAYMFRDIGFGLSKLPAERSLAFVAKLDDERLASLTEGLAASADQVGSWRNTSAILTKLKATTSKEAISTEWELGYKLSDIDPQAFESLIAAQTDPLKHDELLGGFARSVGMNDPPRGLELDAQIQNLAIREDNLDYHLDEWLCSDRAAALSWLRSDEARQLVPAELRGRMLKSYGLEAAR
ncbi:MAG: hypothetical protein IPK32_24950 [Verrucomicrobiaceae bacterium]|nr:hypothetical protein [Verrucomicrobiaceae bacterium]